MPGLFELKAVSFPGAPEGISLLIKPGTIHQIRAVGEKEANLLLQIIVGEVIPESGAVLFEEVPIHEMNHEQLLRYRRSIALVHSKGGLISNLKLWENITLPLLYHHGAVPEETTEQALQLLETLGYKGNIWALPGHLSPAERVMTAFIRAAIATPSLIVYAGNLDELASLQRTALGQEICKLHGQDNAPAALFITTGNEQQLAHLQPDSIQDLCRNSPTSRGQHD